MNTFTRPAVAVALLAAVWASAACSGTDPAPEPTPATSSAVAAASPTACPAPAASPGNGTTPIVVSQSLAVGPNRFTLALQRDGKLMENAPVQVRFFSPCTVAVAFEDSATWLELAAAPEHPHDPSGVSNATAPNGLYVLSAPFEGAGQWFAEISIGTEAPEVVTTGFTVLPQDAGIPLGSPAPRSQTPKAGPGANTKQIDSSNPPRPEMQQMSVAEAVDSGRPALVIFATPAFCRSRICGPVFDEMTTLYSPYKDRVEFIHVEPYELDETGQPVIDGSGEFQVVPSVIEWKFPSEPWVVLIDANGNVAAKFEGLVSAAEVSASLDAVLR